MRRLATAAALVALAGCASARPTAAPAAPQAAGEQTSGHARGPAPGEAAPPEPAGPRELATDTDPSDDRRQAGEARSMIEVAESALGGLDDAARERHAPTVEVIRSLVAESRQALADGDPERARNLAEKAATMAEDL